MDLLSLVSFYFQGVVHVFKKRISHPQGGGGHTVLLMPTLQI